MNLELQTERLSLRPLAQSDLDLAIEMFTDAEVMKYVGRVQTEDQIVNEMATNMRRGGGGCIGVWCIRHRVTNQGLGSVFLLPLPIKEDDTNWELVGGTELLDSEVEIGFVLKRSTWGKGYATEAAERLLRFAFEKTPLVEIVAVIDPGNDASRHVLRKLGLVEEGMRNAYGEQCPGFRITRERWLRGARSGTSD